MSTCLNLMQCRRNLPLPGTMRRSEPLSNTRISQAEKDPKKAKALGVDRQEEDCRRLCIERGWEVVEPVYCDDGISASKYSTKPPSSVRASTERHKDRPYRRHCRLRQGSTLPTSG